MNLSPRALYELGPLGECPHVRARLLCDLSVSRWYVWCPDCDAAGPTSESDQVAIAEWAELVEFVEALEVWNERALETPPPCPPAVRGARPPGRASPARPVLAGGPVEAGL